MVRSISASFFPDIFGKKPIPTPSLSIASPVQTTEADDDSASTSTSTSSTPDQRKLKPVKVSPTNQK